MVHPFVITGVKTLTLVLGGLITYLAVRAYRRTGAPELRALAIGFGIVTLGSILGGLTDLVLDVGLESSVLIESVVTAVGFVVILYSLYTE